jgi:hypothetical protein
MVAVDLLGPVNARIGDVSLRLTRPLERALLARLALAAGHPVDAPRGCSTTFGSGRPKTHRPAFRPLFTGCAERWDPEPRR